MNFITKCFSKVNSELCFNIVEIFIPNPCTCQEAWQVVCFLAVRFFRRSRARVGLWQGSGTSLPAGAVQRARADSADGPLELHIPAELSRASPCWAPGLGTGSWQLLGEGAGGAAVQSCVRVCRGSTAVLLLVVPQGQLCWAVSCAKTGLDVHLGNRGCVQSAQKHRRNFAIFSF